TTRACGLHSATYLHSELITCEGCLRFALAPLAVYSRTWRVSKTGSATQVMLAIRIHATVGHAQPRKQGGHQQPWSSETRAQRVEQTEKRKMVTPAMGSRIISVKRASASLWPWPTTVALRRSSAPWLNTCCVSASRSAGSAARWASV